jgi:hypothetical protein
VAGTLAHPIVDPAPPARRSGGARALASALLLGWAAVTVLTVLAGHRESTFAELRTAVDSGRVEAVEVSEGLLPRSRGYAVVQVRWREGLFSYETQVVEARPLGQARSGQLEGVTAVVPSVAAALREVDPDLRIGSTELGGGLTWYGLTPPSWAGWALLAVFTGTIGLVSSGPAPRAVTRWGWFWWVILTPPVGPIAFLLVSGPATGRRWDGSTRRTGGGVSFFLAVLAGAALAAVVNAVG